MTETKDRKTDEGAAPTEATNSAPPPKISRQKTFILENAGVLNRETKLAILALVMMEIGPTVLLETGDAVKEVDVDLDAVGDANAEVLRHIYNIVRARLDSLSQPARTGGSDQAPPGRA